LFLPEDGIGGHVVVLLEVLWVDVEELLYVIHCLAGSKDEEEVDIAVYFLFGERDVRF